MTQSATVHSIAPVAKQLATALKRVGSAQLAGNDAALKHLERAALELHLAVKELRRPRDSRLLRRYDELVGAGVKTPRLVVAKEFGLSPQRVSNIVSARDG